MGFLSGILLDIFYGYSGVIGMNGILFMYLGYINGLFNEIFYTDDICIPVLLTMASDLAYNFLYYCVTFLLRGYLDLANYFKAIIFPEVIYTALITLVVYRLLLALNHKLEKAEQRSVGSFV